MAAGPARVRKAARVLLIDESGDTLLIQGSDPAAPEAGTWWFTPGGGIEGDESPGDAAVREILEETGLRLDELTGPIWERSSTFTFDGEILQQEEVYFVAHVQRFTPSPDGWTDLERRHQKAMRWWAVDEIQASTETIYPENLATLLEVPDNNTG